MKYSEFIRTLEMNLITVTVEKTSTGFSAGADKYPVYTAGDSLEEIKENMTEALNLYFEHNKKPLVHDEEIQLNLDLAFFFEFYKVLNVKALSTRIGINESDLTQYIHGSKKPTKSQASRIIKGINQLGRELVEIRLTL